MDYNTKMLVSRTLTVPWKKKKNNNLLLLCSCGPLKLSANEIWKHRRWRNTRARCPPSYLLRQCPFRTLEQKHFFKIQYKLLIPQRRCIKPSQYKKREYFIAQLRRICCRIFNTISMHHLNYLLAISVWRTAEAWNNFT